MQDHARPTPSSARLTANALLDPEQFHFEDQSAVGRDLRTGAVGTVGQVGWNGELELISHLHELESLRPTGYDRVQREADRLSTLNRTVEYSAIEQSAVVVHL